MKKNPGAPPDGASYLQQANDLFRRSLPAHMQTKKRPQQLDSEPPLTPSRLRPPPKAHSGASVLPHAPLTTEWSEPSAEPPRSPMLRRLGDLASTVSATQSKLRRAL